MNRGRLYSAIAHVERTHSRGLGERPSRAPVQRSPDKPAATTGGRPRRILAANPAMRAAIKYAAPPPEKKPPPAPTPDEQRKRRKARAQQVEALLRERWPAAFPDRHKPPPPLAVGIHATIRELDLATFPVRPLRQFMRYWVGRRMYREALARGDERVNLDGSPAGPTTPEQQAIAAASLKGAAGKPSGHRTEQREPV